MLVDRLAPWLAAKLDADDVGVDELVRHAEGFSWETFTFSAAWRDRAGTAQRRGFALRREPVEGTLERYSAARDYGVHAAVATHSAVPMPALWWLEEDPTPLERPFYVMERVHGTVPVPWAGKDPRVFPSDAARRALGEEFVDVLAQIHRIELEHVAFLRAPASSDDAARAAIADWERQYEQAVEVEIPLLRHAFGWLRANLATSGALALVHGDYRIGNFMIDAERHINAIFDWELAHVGDPIFDIAYGALRLYRGRSPLLSQLLAAEDFFPLYTSLTGVPVEPAVFRFWTVLGYVRALTQYVRACRAFSDGRADDLRLAAMAHESVHLMKFLAEELGLR